MSSYQLCWFVKLSVRHKSYHSYWKTWPETNLSNPNAALDNLILEVLEKKIKEIKKIKNTGCQKHVVQTTPVKYDNSSTISKIDR